MRTRTATLSHPARSRAPAGCALAACAPWSPPTPPRFPRRSHSFDWLGVALSATGLFLLVFGIQEGDSYDWGTITDSLVIGPVDTGVPVTVPGMILAGVLVLAVFVLWQAVMRREPLVPLSLFRDRNFSVANVAIAMMGATVIGFAIPTTLFFQQVLGMSPTQAALASHVHRASVAMSSHPRHQNLLNPSADYSGDHRDKDEKRGVTGR